MKRDNGFVLINALILVAALSAVAVYLLSRAEGSRARLEAIRTADALALGLDAVEALALTRLDADLRRDDIDHLDEAWARPETGLDLALGTAEMTISDAQGRFNLNWLADPDDTEARAAFDRLIASLGLPPQVAVALAGFVRPDGPGPGDDTTRRLPSAPIGGNATMLPQITGIPGINASIYARLAPHLAALSGDSGLNVNTATPEVLAAFLPDLPRARLDRALAARRVTPFATVDAFFSAIGEPPAPADADEGGEDDDDDTTDAMTIRQTRLTVGSAWFRLDTTVMLNGRRAQRQALIQRRGRSEGAHIAWRLTAAP